MNQVTRSPIQTIKTGVLGRFNLLLIEKVTVNFENAGKKVINAKNIELKRIK